MADDLTNRPPDDETDYSRQVAAKAARKLKVLREGPRGVWFGLGMSGLVGWSVAIPTVAGAVVGLWWDRRHPGAHSWTLALLTAGLVVGCANAWHWIVQQDRSMHDDDRERPDE
jgi:ATP synthase protein I